MVPRLDAECKFALGWATAETTKYHYLQLTLYGQVCQGLSRFSYSNLPKSTGAKMHPNSPIGSYSSATGSKEGASPRSAFRG
jgi:hypothetical protein